MTIITGKAITSVGMHVCMRGPLRDAVSTYNIFVHVQCMHTTGTVFALTGDGAVKA